MIISGKLGNLNSDSFSKKKIDWLHLEWYEANKRIMHKYTVSGREIVFRFLGRPQELTEGDILFEDGENTIAVTIVPCDTMVVHPSSMFEMAAICYEIGNKHLPLYFENNAILVPFDKALYSLLAAQGYQVHQEKRKLLQPIKTTVAPHGVQLAGESIFKTLYKQPV